MSLEKDLISKLVEDVMRELQEKKVLEGSSGQTPPNQPGIFSTVDQAVEAARASQQQLQSETLEKRKEIIQAMRQAAIAEAEPLARMAREETGLGRAADKVHKNLLAATKTPGVEDVTSTAWTGDHGLTLVELAPWGIIGAITPSTNPSSTIINNSIGMVAAGNAVVFNPHPGAKRVSQRTIAILNQAIRSAGGPETLLTAVAEPTLETSTEVMSHPGIPLLVVTGGGAVVKAALASGKKVIAAGPGNPPVVVDETADLEKAGRDIVNGASFDNNVLCLAEKEIIAVADIADRLKRVMLANGAYEAKGSELERLEALLLTGSGGVGCAHPVLNRKYVGKDAEVILREIGAEVPDDIRLIVVETGPDHPFVWAEMLMPVIPLVRVPDVDVAIDLAVKVEQGHHHTAIIHSNDIRNLSRMAREMNTCIFVKNGPSYCGLGFGGEGHATLTIAAPTGEGLTSARHFTRSRRCVLVDKFRII